MRAVWTIQPIVVVVMVMNATKLHMRYSEALFFIPSYVQISSEHLVLVRVGFTLRAR